MTEITIETLLGGASVTGHSIENSLDLFEVSRNGLPKKSLLNLIDNLGLSLRTVAGLLNITERTIQRKKDSDLLDQATTEQILQIAEVFFRGYEVFGSLDNFRAWLDIDNISLGGHRPVDLLGSRFGARMVLDTIGRIEQGVFS